MYKWACFYELGYFPFTVIVMFYDYYPLSLVIYASFYFLKQFSSYLILPFFILVDIHVLYLLSPPHFLSLVFLLRKIGVRKFLVVGAPDLCRWYIIFSGNLLVPFPP